MSIIRKKILSLNPLKIFKKAAGAHSGTNLKASLAGQKFMKSRFSHECISALDRYGKTLCLIFLFIFIGSSARAEDSILRESLRLFEQNRFRSAMENLESALMQDELQEADKTKAQWLLARSCIKRGEVLKRLDQAAYSIFPRYYGMLMEKNLSEKEKTAACLYFALCSLANEKPFQILQCDFQELMQNDAAKGLTNIRDAYNAVVQQKKKDGKENRSQGFQAEYYRQLLTRDMKNSGIPNEKISALLKWYSKKKNLTGRELTGLFILKSVTQSKSNSVRPVTLPSDLWEPELQTTESLRRLRFYDPFIFNAGHAWCMKRAVECLEEVIRKAPSAKDNACYLLGTAHLELGNFKAALEAFEQSAYRLSKIYEIAALYNTDQKPKAETLIQNFMDSHDDEILLHLGRTMTLYIPAYRDEGTAILNKSHKAESRKLKRLSAVYLAEIAQTAERKKEALEKLATVYDHHNRDNLEYNPPLLLLNYALMLFYQGGGSFPVSVETLYALLLEYPEAKPLHDLVQGIYADRVKRGGDQKLDTG